MWSKRREISAALNPRAGQGVLSFAPDEQVYEIDAVVDRGLSFSSPRGPHAQQQAVGFRCDDPAWRVAAVNEQTVATDTTKTVTNAGDLASYHEVHVDIDAASTTGPKVSNLTTGHDFVVDDSFGTGDEITIDMDARTVVDENGASLMAKRTPASQMWAIEPGSNDLRATQTAGDLTVRYRWWTRLVGI